MAKWLLVNGYNLAYRCFFAIPELTRADGFPTNALHGWVKSIWKLADQEKPEGTLVFFDLGGAQDRLAIHPHLGREFLVSLFIVFLVFGRRLPREVGETAPHIFSPRAIIPDTSWTKLSGSIEAATTLSSSCLMPGRPTSPNLLCCGVPVSETRDCDDA